MPEGLKNVSKNASLILGGQVITRKPYPWWSPGTHFDQILLRTLAKGTLEDRFGQKSTGEQFLSVTSLDLIFLAPFSQIHDLRPSKQGQRLCAGPLPRHIHQRTFLKYTLGYSFCDVHKGTFSAYTPGHCVIITITLVMNIE